VFHEQLVGVMMDRNVVHGTTPFQPEAVRLVREPAYRLRV
jgi:hypothetical protein